MIDVKALVNKLVDWLKSLFKSTYSEYTDEQIRRQRVSQLIDYYKGNQLTYLESVFTKQFENPKALRMQPAMSNIVRYITDTLCMTFKHGVIVSAQSPTDQPLYDEMIDQVSFDAFVKTLEQTVFLTKTTFVKVTPLLTPEGNFSQMNLSIITPEFTTVVPQVENPLEIGSIVYPKNISRITDAEGTYVYWDASSFQIVNDEGAQMYDAQDAPAENPYKIIPVVVFREKVPVDSDFYQWPSEELITAQDNLNVLLTSLNQLIKFQSFAQPVLIDPPDSMSGKVQIKIDPSRALVVVNADGKKGDFKYVTPDAKINEVQDAIDKAYIRVFSFYGLNASDFVASGDAQSAQAIIESNAKVEEYRSNVRQVFIPQLIRLLEVMRTVWNVHHSSDKQISDAGVTIKIQQSRVSYQSIADQIADCDWQVTNGYMSHSDVMLLLNDDLTAVEAQTMREKNLKDNGTSVPQTNVVAYEATGSIN